MRRIVQWAVKMASLLFTKIRERRQKVRGTSGSAQLPAQAAESSAATPTVSVNDEQANTLFGQILHDCRMQERRIFRIFCRPLGGVKGSDVICEVTKRYKIGTRITRTDGRSYEIYRVKKTKRTRIEGASPMSMWRAVA